MRFYFSGSEAIRPGPLRDWLIMQCPWRLQSCHGDYIKTAEAWMKRAVELGASKDMDIMLDSGAFTAWSKGGIMEMEKLLPVYTEFQQKYGAHFKSMVFINLDVIPGTRSKAPTEKDITQALIDSDKNFNKLTTFLGSGCILPVYHQGEPQSRLAEVCQQSKYVCISPRQTISNKFRVEWVRSVQTYLDDLDISSHGLATTGNLILQAAHWFSVDSATWVIGGGLGRVLLIINGKLISVAVSLESPQRHVRDEHITTLPPKQKELVVDCLERYGFNLEQVTTSHEYRKAFNLVSLRDWSKNLNVKTYKTGGFFDAC